MWHVLIIADILYAYNRSMFMLLSNLPLSLIKRYVILKTYYSEQSTMYVILVVKSPATLESD